MTQVRSEQSTNLSSRLAPLLLVVAVLSFAVAVRPGVAGPAAAVVLATIALASGLAKLSPGALSEWERREPLILIGVVVLAAIAIAEPLGGLIGPSNVLLDVGPPVAIAALGLLVYWNRTRWTRRKATAFGVTAMLFVLFAGIFHVALAEGIGFDVLFLHTEAAEALVQGENPYTDVVTVQNGASNAGPDDLIVGYPYPPVTLAGYVAAELALDDPRFLSLAAYLTFLGAMLTIGRRSSRLAVYLVLVMAVLPGWPLVLRAAWTEPLSLAFLALGLLAFPGWRRSGAWLGLGLASKQYFLVTAPAILFHRDRIWLRRLALVAAVIAVTLGIGMAVDLQAFWSAAVEFHANTPPRPGSLNLVGLVIEAGSSWDPPLWLGLVLGLLASGWAANRSQSGSHLMLAMALGLAVSFLFASQAFANYWFLVTGMVAVATLAAVESSERPAIPPPQPHEAHGEAR